MIFIADISSNHCGDINKAKQLIYEAKECNVQIAKFQYFNADTLINAKQFRNMQKSAHQEKWSKSVYQTYKDYELPLDFIPVLAEYAKSIGIGFAVTVYDIDLIDEIDKYNIVTKIGSGDITYLDLLEKSSMTKKPILLGTGASNINEVILATNIIEQRNRNIVLFQCNTNYETDQKKINYSCINVLKSYKTYFPDYQLGLSDHSKSIHPVLLARALGAVYIERHFKGTLEPDSPDNDFSLTYNEWKFMVNEVNTTEKVLGNTFKEVCQNEYETRIIQRRALYAKKDLREGQIITKDDIIALRPCLQGMITPLSNLVGLKLKKNIKKDDPFLWENLELENKE